MDELNLLIVNLNNINNQILYSVTEDKHLHQERQNIIINIDRVCKSLKPSQELTHLIKKYLTIQQSYRDKMMQLQVTQIQIKDPSISRENAQIMIKNGEKNHLCLTAFESLNYVTQRHKEIIKLKNSLQELYELWIGTYAIVEQQGHTIDRIQTHISSAKHQCKWAKQELQSSLQ